MKSKEEIKKWFDQLYTDMYNSIYNQEKQGNLMVYNFSNNKSPIEVPHIDEIQDEYIVYFYKSIDKWKVRWKTAKKKLKFEAEGIFDFLPIEKVMADYWDNDFGGNDYALEMKGFRPLDMFYEMEGHVGFFVGRPDKKGLYLSENDGEAQPLHVDFEGYLKLLAMSKGYGWWQSALVEISTGVSKAGVEKFKENMPKIFPEFNWDEFVALYQSVRIDK